MRFGKQKAFELLKKFSTPLILAIIVASVFAIFIGYLSLYITACFFCVHYYIVAYKEDQMAMNDFNLRYDAIVRQFNEIEQQLSQQRMATERQLRGRSEKVHWQKEGF